MHTTIQQLLHALGGTYAAPDGSLPADINIQAIAPLENAEPSSISFIARPQFLRQLGSCQASCLIVSETLQNEAALARFNKIITPDAYLYYARLTQWWRQQEQLASDEPRIHPSSVIHPSAKVDASARIGALCVVEAGASIGAQTQLASRVTVGRDCHIGARGIIHSGVVLGADGFGFAQDAGRWEKIEQLGRVLIGDDVEIGANTCIDRGALGDTVIEDGVKLDNLIQIGHNVHIGQHSALAGCVGVAGSAKIGAHCTIGGGAIVLGHLELADKVHISAASVVTRSIRKAGNYTGIFPLDENANWEKNAVTLKQLYALRERVRGLEKKQH